MVLKVIKLLLLFIKSLSCSMALLKVIEQVIDALQWLIGMVFKKAFFKLYPGNEQASIMISFLGTFKHVCAKRVGNQTSSP